MVPMRDHILQVGSTYSAEIRGYRKLLCTGLSYVLESLNVQTSPVDITRIGEEFRSYVPIDQGIILIGEASSTCDISFGDVCSWCTNIVCLFDIDPPAQQHWDSRILETSHGSSARHWIITSQSMPFVAFP